MTESVHKKTIDQTLQEAAASPTGILSAAEINDWAAKQGYRHVTRGTYTNEATFLYIKGCLRVDTEEEVDQGLAVVRYLTEKGVVHPRTAWSAFEPDEGAGFQIFAVAPAIEGWSIERIGTAEERRFGTESTQMSPHITEWVQRIDEDYAPGQAIRPDSLARILNLTEASHPDNWGWDPATDINYPTDIEVIGLAHNLDVVRQWATTAS